MVIAIYGIPILVGIILGHTLSRTASVAVSLSAVAVAFYSYWSAGSDGLGSFPGLVVAVLIAIVIIAQWVTICVIQIKSEK